MEIYKQEWCQTGHKLIIDKLVLLLPPIVTMSTIITIIIIIILKLHNW